jgi:crossover junction endodeoxyribonuclease RuvC
VRIIGIDCGLTGALASLDEAGEVRYFADLPVASNGRTKWIDGGRLLTMLFKARDGGRGPARVAVEFMHALPMIADDDNPNPTARGGGIWAASAKGMVLGSVLAILQVAELPYDLITPQKWKRALELMMPSASYAAKKQASLDRARAMFPNVKLDRAKDHGRAEALLIAHYAQRYLFAPDLLGDKAA